MNRFAPGLLLFVIGAVLLAYSSTLYYRGQLAYAYGCGWTAGVLDAASPRGTTPEYPEECASLRANAIDAGLHL
jgi:hypothetical protein